MNTSDSSTSNTVNPSDPLHPITAINMVNITKLTSTNYLTWSVQIKSLLKGYDLTKFIDATAALPTATVTTNSIVKENPAYTAWQRQDSLLYSALIGTIETPLQPLIASSTTTLAAWTTLSSTYGKPTRGHIKQLKLCVKGTKTIDEYMQFFKTKSDALALLGSPQDAEDLTDIILDGLGDDYKTVIESVHIRDTPISFSELHEKLLNREIAILST